MIEVVEAQRQLELRSPAQRAIARGVFCSVASLPLLFLGSIIVGWMERPGIPWIEARFLWGLIVVGGTAFAGLVFGLKALCGVRSSGGHVLFPALCIVAINLIWLVVLGAMLGLVS